jgi:hypothetical protein
MARTEKIFMGHYSQSYPQFGAWLKTPFLPID